MKTVLGLRRVKVRAKGNAQDMASNIVVMGVSGSGKSTVGAALAERLRIPFEDADELHPAANIAKMASGHPLDDDDRRQWLDRVGEWLAAHPDGGVMSCSALKRRYRDQLRRHCPALEILHLTGSADLIAARQQSRTGHFMPASLLASQFADLEPLGPDEDGVMVDVGQPVERIVDEYLSKTGRATA